MSHNTTLKFAVAAAFDAADDIDALIQLDYIVPGIRTGFNPLTETYDTDTGDTTHTLKQVLAEPFTAEERFGSDIRNSDIKLTFQQANLAVIAKTSHSIIIDDVRYSIESKQSDPAKLTWVLQIRGAEDDNE